MGKNKENVFYVVNNGSAYVTKRGIIGPGGQIFPEDFRGEKGPEIFDRLVKEEKIILKDKYEPDSDENSDETNINVDLHAPDSVKIPEDHIQQIKNFIKDMKIPEVKKNEVIKEIKEYYQDSYFMFKNLKYQFGLLNKMALDSSLVKLKHIEDDYKPKTKRIISDPNSD